MNTATPWSLYTPVQRWSLLAILLLVTVSNYFDYFILSVLLEPIKKEFKVSDTMLGLLSGLSFALLYAITAIPIARWSDRGNRRSVITIALALWSVMTVACGYARSFSQLVVARFVIGAVEPGGLPPAQSLVADYFPPERRALAVSILTQGGSAAGWLVGIGVGGYVAATMGWRSAFLLAGIPGLLLGVLAWVFLKEPRVVLGFPDSRADSDSAVRTIATLLHKRSFTLVLVGLSLYAIFSYGLATFVPSFMIRSLHASLELVSMTWGVIIAIANLAGAVFGGWLTDILSRRDKRWYAWVPAVACTVSVVTYGLALNVGSTSAFIAVDAVAEFIAAAGTPAAFTAIHAVCGTRRRTIAISTALLLFALFGSGVGPPLVGAFSDAVSARFGSDSLRYSLLAIVLFLIPAAVAFYWAGIALPRDLDD